MYNILRINYYFQLISNLKIIVIYAHKYHRLEGSKIVMDLSVLGSAGWLNDLEGAFQLKWLFSILSSKTDGKYAEELVK